MADKSGAKRERRTRKKEAKSSKPDNASERLGRMESMLDLLLKAALRGRLLPADRREVKRYLAARKEEHREPGEQQRAEVPRCPVCRSPLDDPAAERCPHCRVLLDVAS
ncbi:MAG: hypothetical protein JXR96_09495 [Deltaproteobacteria bacterium]|nr:hypothetical protein [Deltaproteobacteria bacterium]